MQRMLESDTLRRKRGGNLDFSLHRCTTEKLNEEMNADKAITILKLPKPRSNALNIERPVMEDHFKDYICNNRVKVSHSDPQYHKKVEQRHVLELLLHESYQHLTKYGDWFKNEEGVWVMNECLPKEQDNSQETSQTDDQDALDAKAKRAHTKLMPLQRRYLKRIAQEYRLPPKVKGEPYLIDNTNRTLHVRSPSYDSIHQMDARI